MKFPKKIFVTVDQNADSNSLADNLLAWAKENPGEDGELVAVYHLSCVKRQVVRRNLSNESVPNE